MKIGKLIVFTSFLSISAYAITQHEYSSNYNWINDNKQSSTEDINVTTDFFWNKRESLQRFLIKSNKCKSSTDWANTKVQISSQIFNYRYACNDDGYIIIAGVGFEEIARTMHIFEVSEKYGDNVNVIIFDKKYNFDAAGYKKAIVNSTKYYRSL